ncbi:MAG: hypothetical protein ACRDZ3_00065 [Acidimicrobiia bacterium]
MQTIICPSCATARTVTRLSWSADEFCARCDFPLFWAPGAYEASTAVAVEEPEPAPVAAPATVWPPPGEACPTCGKINAEDALYCNRCATPMNASVQPVPQLLPPDPVEIPDGDQYDYALLACLCVIGGLAFALLLCVLG